MTVDKDDYNGVLASPKGRDEVDLMKLVLHKPVPDNGGDVKLTVTAGSVVLWKESTHQNKHTLTSGSITFPTTDLDKTIWVELTAASVTLRDVTLTLTYGGATDTVRATGIWATRTGGFRNSNPPTTLTTAAMNSNLGSNQITVAAPAGFAVGDHIIIFGPTPKNFDITAITGSVFSLNDVLGTAAGAGNDVRIGMSREIDKTVMIDSFLIGGGKLGAAHVSPRTNNAMEMQFTVGPPGIGSEPGVVFDISRQRESYAWRLDLGLGMWFPYPDGKFNGRFPISDEGVNDDTPTNNQQDEFNTPVANHIYSRDMPGLTTDVAGGSQRLVLRFNMREFVRVKLNGIPFTNVEGPAEGSRASPKAEWYSRMDVIMDNKTGLWTRNNIQPANEKENEIELGQKSLSRNIPPGAPPIPNP